MRRGLHLRRQRRMEAWVRFYAPHGMAGEMRRKADEFSVLMAELERQLFAAFALPPDSFKTGD